MPTLTICDTGHNAHGVRYVAEQLQVLVAEHPHLYCILGFARDKQIDEVLTMFPSEAHYIFTQASTPRALEAETLAEKGHRAGLCGEVQGSVKQALECAREMANREDAIFIGGSNYVVAEIL